MWSYGLDLRSIKLIVVKVVVSSEGTYNNCSFVEVFNWYLDFSNEIRDVEAVIFQTLPLPLPQTKNEKTTVVNIF